MPFQFDERPGSGSMTQKPPSAVLLYVAAGEDDKADVMAYAMGATPPIIGSPMGNLFRQDVKVDRVGFQLFNITVPYAPMKKEVGSYTWRWDGSGSTARRNNAVLGQCVSAYRVGGGGTLGTDIPDFKGAIGVHGADNEVEGTDVVVPGSTFTLSFSHPSAWFNLARAAQISALRGFVNSALFLGFAPGEILFMSFTGSEGSDAPTTVDYTFSHSANATGLVVGAITGIAKQGHDYLWVRYKDAVDSDRSVKQPEFVYVDRVYLQTNLSAVLGF